MKILSPVYIFQILHYLNKNSFENIWRGTNCKNLKMGFALMTYRFVVNIITHCAKLLGDNYGKETTYII